jgi:drug/metabolite transporter (DMT)-like permease
MPWYIYALLASFSFVGMVLFIKKLTDAGFSSKRILFFVFLFLFLGFLAINIKSLPSVWKSEQFLPLIYLTSIAGIFSVIGNWADFEGIKRAPNAGYPVAIRNSSVLITVFASVFLFNSELTLFKLIGIIIIVIGMALLVVEKKNIIKKEKDAYPWYIFSFIAFFIFPIDILIVKKAILLVDFSIQNVNLFLFGFALIILSALDYKELKSYLTDRKNLKFFLFFAIGAGLFSFIANITKTIGLDLAPNPGYNDAIVKTNVLFVTLFSAGLFSVKLNKYKLLGVVLVTIGLIIMLI